MQQHLSPKDEYKFVGACVLDVLNRASLLYLQVTQQLEVVSRACQELRSSKQLSDLLCHVLAVGNFLNGSAGSVSAIGMLLLALMLDIFCSQNMCSNAWHPSGPVVHPLMLYAPIPPTLQLTHYMLQCQEPFCPMSAHAASPCMLSKVVRPGMFLDQTYAACRPALLSVLCFVRLHGMLDRSGTVGT